MNKIRISYVVHGLVHIGGIERRIFHVLTGLHSDIDPVIYCLKKSPFAHFISDSGFEVRDLGLPNMSPVSLWKAAGAIAAREADIIHGYGTFPTIAAGIVGRRQNIPVVSERYNLGHGRSFRHKIAAYLANRMSTVISVNSEAVRQVSLKEGGAREKTRLIRTGIPLSTYPDKLAAYPAGKQDDKPVRIVNVANMRWVKNQAMILRAARIVLEQQPAEFILIGDGPERSNLEALTRDLGIEEHVSFLGAMDNAPAVVQQADIFIMTSTSEGHSRAVLEGMQAGLPVIATKVGGLVDEVIPGKTGYLVEVNDDQATADALLTLIRDAELRYGMGKAGRARVEELFTLDTFHAEQLRLYKDVLGLISD